MADDEKPTVTQVIAAGFTTAEREFAIRVGRGEVQPGEYLSDGDRAEAVLRLLSQHGYRVVADG